jgi:hypothetical protein
MWIRVGASWGGAPDGDRARHLTGPGLAPDPGWSLSRGSDAPRRSSRARRAAPPLCGSQRVQNSRSEPHSSLPASRGMARLDASTRVASGSTREHPVEPHFGRRGDRLSSTALGRPRLGQDGVRLRPRDRRSQPPPAPPKCRFVNARPDPDFRYFSNRTASRSLENSMETTSDQGRCWTVWPQGPSLCH